MRDAVIIVAMAVIQNILFYCHPTTAHAPPIFARLFSLKAFIGVELSSGVYHARTLVNYTHVYNSLLFGVSEARAQLGQQRWLGTRKLNLDVMHPLLSSE